MAAGEKKGAGLGAEVGGSSIERDGGGGRETAPTQARTYLCNLSHSMLKRQVDDYDNKSAMKTTQDEAYCLVSFSSSFSSSS